MLFFHTQAYFKNNISFKISEFQFDLNYLAIVKELQENLNFNMSMIKHNYKSI